MHKNIRDMKTKEFITKLLLKAIHDENNSNHFHDLYDKAERIVYWKRETGEDPSYVLMHQIIGSIKFLKNMIGLCRYLKKQGVKIQYGIVSHEDNYYLDIFRSRVKRGREILRKLRPYILEYTKSWPQERKLKDFNDPKLNPFLKGWYIKEEK